MNRPFRVGKVRAAMIHDGRGIAKLRIVRRFNLEANRESFAGIVFIAPGNELPLEPGHAFSVEPGIYLAGRFGARIEDIVIADRAGPVALNHVTHELTVVEA